MYKRQALMVVTDQDLALLTPSTLITRYPSNKILFEPTGKGEPLNIEFYKMRDVYKRQSFKCFKPIMLPKKSLYK